MVMERDQVWERMRVTGVLDEHRVHYFVETGSTNQVAMQLGRQGEPAGTLVVAESQDCGRGRLGRAWLSPPGQGLYFSMLLRPRLEPADLSKITLVAALAVCKAVEEVTGLAPGIKWPNDLLLAGKKFCGILTETGPLAVGKPTLVVLGIGLNVLTSLDLFPEELHAQVTSLAVAGGESLCRGELLAAIVRAVDIEVARLEQGEFASVLADWQRRDATLGKRLAWLTPAGKMVEGVSLGPDGNGILHVRDDSGAEYEVLTGDLTLVQR